MAKLGLLFVAVFCIVQLSLAARLPRETDVETTTDLFGSLRGTFEEGLKNAQKQLQTTFTKENADKLWGTVKEAGEKVNTQFQDFAKDVQTKYTEITKDAEKKD